MSISSWRASARSRFCSPSACFAGPDGGYAFAAIRATHPAPTLVALVLGLVLIGTGSKAGLVPLHAWLPLAHPAAPSHVSALLSGVMTKVAVYAFVRIVFDLLGAAWWWSILVLALAGITCVMGVLYALMQHDLKRLLAYHTVENIGIIFIGLGLALHFRLTAWWAAALAFTAALLHVFNHSLFKSLLFFGAGAVLTATGERDMEHLGGLIHRMPQTAFAFLVGCVAISALPPLNGFVSEWLTFQAILLSPQIPSWGAEIPGARGRRAARALGGSCGGLLRQGLRRDLSRPAAHRAAEARMRPIPSRSPQCSPRRALPALPGILPGYFIDALAPVSQGLLGASMPTQSGDPYFAIVPIAESRSSYDGLLVFIFMVFSATFAAVAIHRLASDRLRRGPAWDCSYPNVPKSGHAIHRIEFCPTDPPRLRHHVVPCARTRRDAVARRYEPRPVPG